MWWKTLEEKLSGEVAAETEVFGGEEGPTRKADIRWATFALSLLEWQHIVHHPQAISAVKSHLLSPTGVSA